MKIYTGQRTIDGLKVTVDGKALDERFDLMVFEANGFEWSYEGDAPRQLALAILADYFAETEQAKENVEVFMTTVIANFDNDWTLNEEEIRAAISLPNF
jgi:hypothetical protein